MRYNAKTEHFFRITAFAFIFTLVAGPVLASEINEQNVVDLANEAREEQGLAPLIVNDQLSQTARLKIADMINGNYFSHNSPAGKTPWEWFEKTGYNYKYAGENLAISFFTAEDQMKAWMESPTHRKNILNPNYQEIGIAVAAGVINGKNSIITVSEFGTKIGAPEVSPAKNFSGYEQKNIVAEENQAKPQIKTTGNNLPQKEVKGWSIMPDPVKVINVSRWISILLMMLALALTPIAFLVVAAEKIEGIYKMKQTAAHQ